MRVTTGLVRGRKLEAPQGMDTRPSSDMTKQAVFNIIQSGQMGIEALSRGAKTAVFIDSAPKAVEVIKSNLKHCGLMEQARVAQMDAQSFLQGTNQKFDIVFLDPPYQQQIINRLFDKVVACMAPGGIIICETERNEQLPEGTGDYTEVKTYLYGRAKVTVYRPSNEQEDE